MAKSVPQRMAIISAGVIMNVIFALFMAVVAYSLGVHEVACGISAGVARRGGLESQPAARRPRFSRSTTRAIGSCDFATCAPP